MIKEPNIIFSKWRRWSHRHCLTEDFDVPRDFGILGIYLFASPEPTDSIKRHILSNVIYIGMSTHITRRLDKRHKAIRQYQEIFNDPGEQQLYFCEWQSPWTNWDIKKESGAEQLAFVRYIERKLIWEYAKKFHRLPIFNKR